MIAATTSQVACLVVTRMAGVVTVIAMTGTRRTTTTIAVGTAIVAVTMIPNTMTAAIRTIVALTIRVTAAVVIHIATPTAIRGTITTE